MFNHWPSRVRFLPFKTLFIHKYIQVNLCQKHLFLPQLTHKIVHLITSSVHENFKLRTCQELVGYANCFCFDNQNNFCTQHVLDNNKYTQVNLCQKFLLLPQQDCSLNYEFSTWKFQAQNMSRTFCVHELFWMSKTITKNNLCTQHVLNLLWAWSFHILNS